MSIPLPGRILPLGTGTFRALRHRNFRLLWLGQVVSLTGTWMQSVAQGWLVLRLSDSPFQLGLVGFCAFAPVLALTLVGGVAADRLPRRPALLWTQGAALGLAAMLAALTASGAVRVSHVAWIALGLGTVNAFDIPIRQSFLQDLVGREDLPNAIALNSMAFNAARLVGPAIAGLLVASFGEAVCFAVNALSFLAVLAGLAAMKVPDAVPERTRSSWFVDLGEAVGYAAKDRRVRVVLSLVVVSSVFGMPYSILMPVFARDVLEVGSEGLGFLMGAAGLGALLGALWLAGRRGDRHHGRVIAAAMAIFGGGLGIFALSRSYPLSVAALVVVGGAMIAQMATSNTYLQLQAPSPLRGRVVSLYTLAFLGMAPFGSLLGGALARWIGAPMTVLIGGATCTGAAAVFAWRLRKMRRTPAAGQAEMP